MKTYDAVVVLGGGVRQEGNLPPWVEARFELAMGLSSAYWMCLSAGTAHRPNPLGADGRPILESAAGAAYLIRGGVDPASILVETASYDTIGNAYFSRVIHAEPARLLRLAIVTSEFHMPRTEKIFRWVYGLDRDEPFALTFLASPNTGMPEQVERERSSREAQSLKTLDATIERVNSMRELHAWLFREHNLYKASELPHRSEQVTEDLRISY